MDPAPHPSHEIVFEIAQPPVFPAPAADGAAAAAALLALPGVLEAHVDNHGTWAMVTFDPGVASVPAMAGCLAAHGLSAARMRRLGNLGTDAASQSGSAD